MGWIFFSHKSNSGEIARRRLKQVLVSDQSGCSPGLIEGIREELIGVLSRYMELDSGRVDIGLTWMECVGRLLWQHCQPEYRFAVLPI